MFDCGIHPALSGENSLPYLSHEEDLELFDVALITHFHLDHCAAVPYLLQKTVFKVGSISVSTVAWTVLRSLQCIFKLLSCWTGPRFLQGRICSIRLIGWHQLGIGTLSHLLIRTDYLQDALADVC